MTTPQAPFSSHSPTAQRWRQRHGVAVQLPRQAMLLRPTNPHGEPTAKPCPLHAGLGEAHSRNKHTPAGWPTNHSALTPPAPRPASLSTILQRASRDNSAFANPHRGNTLSKSGALGMAQPTAAFGDNQLSADQTRGALSAANRPQRPRQAAQVFTRRPPLGRPS